MKALTKSLRLCALPLANQTWLFHADVSAVVPSDPLKALALRFESPFASKGIAFAEKMRAEAESFWESSRLAPANSWKGISYKYAQKALDRGSEESFFRDISTIVSSAENKSHPGSPWKMKCEGNELSSDACDKASAFNTSEIISESIIPVKVELLYPECIDGQAAMTALQNLVASRYSFHTFWLIVNTICMPGTLLLGFLPV
jgi:hypothetical protein